MTRRAAGGRAGGEPTVARMKVAIANFSEPVAAQEDFAAHWAGFDPPPSPPRLSLFEQPPGWGFHIEALGVHLLDRGIAEEVEFWDFADRRLVDRRPNGVLRLRFLNEDDLEAHLALHGYPDLFVNHGGHGREVLRRLEGRCFRVHVPALRTRPGEAENRDAECYLVDDAEQLDERSMLYVPVVNTRAIRPNGRAKERDFVYLASSYPAKRHDIVIDAVRGTELTGHFHPVAADQLDLAGTRITTSGWNQADVVDLLTGSRIAVYPGDRTSSPAAMWECVAAGLPIVVNRDILGGRHLVVEGVTGELASGDEFREAMEHVLAHRDSYRPREHFEEHWDTVATLDAYLEFFARMGWKG
jgi:glycosyltransferase involved in cell wall biosynthesis